MAGRRQADKNRDGQWFKSLAIWAKHLNMLKKFKTAQRTAEAGTGYFKVKWEDEEVSSDMSLIQVENQNKVVAWGAAYWQYFEQLDKITTFEETPLQLKKQLFKESNSPTGPVIATC